jgi:ethanolamine ammonia-lyase small subunit
VSDDRLTNLQPPTAQALAGLPVLMQAIRARTPARILAGSAGPAYRTVTQLELRQDHAAAVDAVHAELDAARDFGEDFVRCWDLFEVSTCAASKSEFLVRPDLGRRLTPEAREKILQCCPAGVDLQVVVGDGLSALAVIAQVPALLPMLAEGARRKGWSFGRTFFIRHCRVGVLNDIGDLLRPGVVVLLIGERPGFATAESLSAYMAYQPRTGHTDAERNLVSNIHARGVAPHVAALRILALAEKMRQMQASGVAVKEDLPHLNPTNPLVPFRSSVSLPAKR